MHPAIDHRIHPNSYFITAGDRGFSRGHKKRQSPLNTGSGDVFQVLYRGCLFGSVDAYKATRLMVPKPSIQTVVCEQFSMGAAFCNLAFFEYNQTVHAGDG